LTGPVVAIVQARLGSTRLPNKVLKDLAGRPMIDRVLERVARAHTIQNTVVATTTHPRDDALVAHARTRGWTVVRGSEDDVLDRYVRAAAEAKAEVVVRITSDCPLLSPSVVDHAVRAHLEARPAPDYTSNVLPPRTYPLGLDVEVMTRAALERAGREDRNPAWREHVTPYLYRHPEAFRLLRVAHDVDLSHHRWTVDTPQDFELVRRVYEALRDEPFEWTDVLALLARHPDWNDLNRGVVQKKVP
jgi:spore coat polysaccharide biosynthesis protein SpsF